MTEMLNKIKELIKGHQSFSIHEEFLDRRVKYVFYAPGPKEDLWCVSIIRDDTSEHRTCTIDVCESGQALLLTYILNDSRLVQVIGCDGLITGTLYIYLNPINEHNGMLKRKLILLEERTLILLEESMFGD